MALVSLLSTTSTPLLREPWVAQWTKHNNKHLPTEHRIQVLQGANSLPSIPDPTRSPRSCGHSWFRLLPSPVLSSPSPELQATGWEAIWLQGELIIYNGDNHPSRSLPLGMIKKDSIESQWVLYMRGQGEGGRVGRVWVEVGRKGGEKREGGNQLDI